jgi:hypothetical protein
VVEESRMFRTWLCTTHAAPVTHTYRRHLPPPRGAQATTAQQGGTLVTSHKYHPSLHCSHEALLVCPSESTQDPAHGTETTVQPVPARLSGALLGAPTIAFSEAPSRCTDHSWTHHLTDIAASSAPQNMHGVVRVCDFVLRATGPQNGHPPFPSGENDNVIIIYQVRADGVRAPVL